MLPAILPLVISAPFGNYIRPAGATPTLGTFTLERRRGRLWRVLKTVRYYPRLRAWVNKIGLRNPGMPWLVERVAQGREDVSRAIVSIHGFAEGEWWQLLELCAPLKPMAIELNLSCPNVGHVTWPAGLFERAVATGVPIVAKLPPVNYRGMFDEALGAGVRVFHCCNTLPVPAGGMSGKPLKPLSLQCIADVLERLGPVARAQVLVIGGGGITEPSDIDDYARVGADRFAVASRCFNPVLVKNHAGLRPLVERATERAGSARG